MHSDTAAARALADRWGVNPAFFWMWGRAPAHPVEVDDYGICHVHGYPEVLQVLGDHTSFSNDVIGLMAGDTVDPELTEGALLQTDPPEHTKLRRIISKAFTPRMVAALEPRIAEVTHELLDAVAGQDRMEMVDDLTYPMPVIVISELLGVPHSDRELFKKWVDRMASSAVALTSGDRNPEDDLDPQAAVRAVPELLDYLRAHAAERRVTPREDLLTKLVEAEIDGERLSESAVVNFANELLVVGHATTSALLGNALLCLDAHPETMARARADRSLVPAVIEESLRYMSPIAVAYKATVAPTEIAGVRVHPGQMVAVGLAAANRDERQFDHPHVFDPDRPTNPHLGFGRGIHFCLGAPLARLEGRIAVEILLERFPKLRADPDARPEFLPLPHVIATSKLPLLTA
ncbi:cytochrome P450 [Streptomyces aurantiogriseus]|uniref:Cytochrome P450 n=1 Tax=Streptomyces aurantiogriseus TaxID=66870 RepID=A0A918L0G1_9ACTN|nr:cytochrome P450 [Streptomyces aurantiogriseus]GGR63902.1 cytochrome P450 [Streptomyces aurantiogriseus]